MSTNETKYKLEEYFQRALTAHLPPHLFAKLQNTTVLQGGVGGGSNIAELLVRKGIGHLIISDLDRYEPHNIRQRCSLVSTLGVEKVLATQKRLEDVHPYVKVTPVREGITLQNVDGLVKQSDIVVDMLDLHAINEKVALHRACRKYGRFALTAPSVINGAVLWVFAPDGVTFEDLTGYRDGMDLHELAWVHLRRVIKRFPEEVPDGQYEASARGERTIPLDAVGVEQAAVLVAGAVENLVLGRMDRVVLAPKGIQVDVSNPKFMYSIMDLSEELEVANVKS